MNQALSSFLDALLAIDRPALRSLAAAAAARGRFAPMEDLIVPALERIGEQWELGEVSLSQVYMSGRLCEELVDTLPPSAASDAGAGASGSGSGPSSAGRSQPILAIAVLDDYHLLGKRMVCSVLRASGYQVIDYGTVDYRTLAGLAVRDRIEILLLSVLMLPSALRIRDLRAALDQAGQRTRILVGGAPFRFDPNLWREVGADGAGATAADALALVRAATETST